MIVFLYATFWQIHIVQNLKTFKHLKQYLSSTSIELVIVVVVRKKKYVHLVFSITEGEKKKKKKGIQTMSDCKDNLIWCHAFF